MVPADVEHNTGSLQLLNDWAFMLELIVLSASFDSISISLALAKVVIEGLRAWKHSRSPAFVPSKSNIVRYV